MASPWILWLRQKLEELARRRAKGHLNYVLAQRLSAQRGTTYQWELYSADGVGSWRQLRYGGTPQNLLAITRVKLDGQDVLIGGFFEIEPIIVLDCPPTITAHTEVLSSRPSTYTEWHRRPQLFTNLQELKERLRVC